MPRAPILFSILFSILFAAITASLFTTANAANICTLFTEPSSGTVRYESGDCDTRATPASTFKIALALMGYDAGYLKDANEPRLPYRDEYVDWGGADWTQDTDPQRWLTYSVVWYSRQITKALGTDTLTRYAADFNYGNADFSGDQGKNNGLERAWIESSLKISPREQTAFLTRLTDKKLPISAEAMVRTQNIINTVELDNGWTIYGKTGSAYPRYKDGSFNRSRMRGWFVGWAEKDDKTLVFTSLNQDQNRTKGPAGQRAKLAFIKQWKDALSELGNTTAD